MQLKGFLVFWVFLGSFMILAMTAYLLYAGKITAGGGLLLIVAAAIFSILVLNADTISSLVVSWGDKGGIHAEMNRIREDVYAKADVVRNLGEEMARFAAQTVAGSNRLADSEHTEEMLEERERIRGFMQTLGSVEDKIADTLEEINRMVVFDLKNDVKAGTSKIFNSINFTSSKPLNVLGPEIFREINGYKEPSERQQLNDFLMENKVYDPSVEKSLDRLDLFLKEGHL